MRNQWESRTCAALIFLFIILICIVGFRLGCAAENLVHIINEKSVEMIEISGDEVPVGLPEQ